MLRWPVGITGHGASDLWVWTRRGAVYRWRDGAWHAEGDNIGARVRSLATDGRSAWAVSDEGVHRFDGRRWRLDLPASVLDAQRHRFRAVCVTREDVVVADSGRQAWIRPIPEAGR